MQCLSSLVIVEHRGGKLAASPHNTSAAAARLSAVDGRSTGATALLAGESVAEPAQQADALPWLATVLVADPTLLRPSAAHPHRHAIVSLVGDLRPPPPPHHVYVLRGVWYLGVFVYMMSLR